jgi:hypothetical protein
MYKNRNSMNGINEMLGGESPDTSNIYQDDFNDSEGIN